MADFCNKCGSELNEKGQCPKCSDFVKLSKKNKTKKIAVIVISAVLCIAIAGIAYGAHKGIINIPFLKNNRDKQQTTSVSDTTDAPAAEVKFSPEKIYSEVLNTYKNAFANNYYPNNDNSISEEDEFDISKFTPEIEQSFGGINSPLSYAYYDISSDGVPELIISLESGYSNGEHIVDILGYENGEVKRLFALSTFTARAEYSINTDGYIRFYGTGGAEYSGETYYRLEKNSATPMLKENFAFEFGNNTTKYFSGSESNMHEITQNEYDSTVSKFGEFVNFESNTLCEIKLYEAEFSVRGENGINKGYQQLAVTNETADELTAAYTQVGEGGYPVYIYPGTVFKVKKNGEKSNIKWTDKAGSEFTGTVSYQDGNFTLSYETNSPDSKIKQCTGATLHLRNSDYTDTSSKTSQTTNAATQKKRKYRFITLRNLGVFFNK